MFLKDLSFNELVNLEEWQSIQDSFSEVLEVTLRTLSLNGRLLSRISRPNRLCNRLQPNTPAFSDFCAKCILKDSQAVMEIKEETNFKCSFGLDLFVVPIMAVGNMIVAHIIVGPLIMNRRKDTPEYAEYAQKSGIELTDLMDALVDINVFSYNKIYSVTKLVRNIFSHITQAGYHKKRLGEMAPEIMEMDPLFLRYYEEKILTAMLNVCMLALDTDSGSVMIVDKNTNKLHIKVAAKLDQAVVHNTNIKIGEGIAGVAAANAEPIVLPEDEDRCGLSAKMKRKYIKSSMIVPFPKGKNHEVYGVINLNILRKNVSFSKNDIAFVQELLNLASIALIPFHKSNSFQISNPSY